MHDVGSTLHDFLCTDAHTENRHVKCTKAQSDMRQEGFLCKERGACIEHICVYRHTQCQK